MNCRVDVYSCVLVRLFRSCLFAGCKTLDIASNDPGSTPFFVCGESEYDEKTRSAAGGWQI